MAAADEEFPAAQGDHHEGESGEVQDDATPSPRLPHGDARRARLQRQVPRLGDPRGHAGTCAVVRAYAVSTSVRSASQISW